MPIQLKDLQRGDGATAGLRAVAVIKCLPFGVLLTGRELAERAKTDVNGLYRHRKKLATYRLSVGYTICYGTERTVAEAKKRMGAAC